MDKDGKLKAEEFILAMHLVDMAKAGQPLPLTLPTELVPPSQRYVDTFESIYTVLLIKVFRFKDIKYGIHLYVCLFNI